MTITNSQATKINKMNRAAQDVTMGTLLQTIEINIDTLEGKAITSGSLLVSSSQANGSQVAIITGLSSITGYNIDIYRSGSAVNSDQYVTTSSGSLVIEPGSSYAVTTNDRINWMAF